MQAWRALPLGRPVPRLAASGNFPVNLPVCRETHPDRSAVENGPRKGPQNLGSGPPDVRDAMSLKASAPDVSGSCFSI